MCVNTYSTETDAFLLLPRCERVASASSFSFLFFHACVEGTLTAESTTKLLTYFSYL